MSSNSPTDPPPRPLSPATASRGRILLTRFAFGGAALLTLIVGFYLVVSSGGNAAWKTYREEAHARGVKLTLADCVPPPVPDERNFAAVPLFQDAFQTPPPPDPVALPEKGSLKVPALDTPSRNTPIDLAAWQKFFVAAKFISAPGEKPAADVLTALEHYAPQFAQLRTAGVRPECRFPVRYEDGVAARLPHLQLLREAGRLYTLRLAAHLALGDSAAGYEDFQAGLRLYAALENEPTLVSGLVRLAILNTLENAVWGGLVRHQWTSEDLARITADLTAVRLMDDYAISLTGERGFHNMVYDQLMHKSPGEIADLVGQNNGHEYPEHRPLQALFSVYPSGWFRLSQTRTNRYIDEMLARVGEQPPRIFPDRSVPSLPASGAKTGAWENLRYRLFFLSAPAVGEVERSFAFSQTFLDETRLGCSLERHRIAHGNFPASLEALAPTYLPALPVDVMTGAPLQYRAEPTGGYTLYSVGSNLQDDGGKFVANDSAKKQSDWVWLMPPPAQP